MRRAIVTGAGGFLGTAMCKSLLLDGYEVLAISRNAERINLEHANLCRISMGYQDYHHLADFVGKDNIDVLFHFAWGSPWGEGFSDYATQYESVVASATLIEAACTVGIKRFVFSGTYNQYEAMQLVSSKGAMPRMTTVYSAAKLACDLTLKTLAHNQGIEYCSGLIAMLYGPGDRSSKLPNVIISQLIAGTEPKFVSGERPYDCIYIDDAVRAFRAIADLGIPGTSYYVGHKESRTFRSWMLDFRDVIAPGVHLAFGAYSEQGGVEFDKIDMDALHCDTGFECRSNTKQSILNTAKWIKENDPLGMF